MNLSLHTVAKRGKVPPPAVNLPPPIELSLTTFFYDDLFFFSPLFFAAPWRIFAAPTELFTTPYNFCPLTVDKSDGFMLL